MLLFQDCLAPCRLGSNDEDEETENDRDLYGFFVDCANVPTETDILNLAITKGGGIDKQRNDSTHTLSRIISFCSQNMDLIQSDEEDDWSPEPPTKIIEIVPKEQMVALPQQTILLADRGYPGFLTEQEYSAYLELTEETETRSSSFLSTIRGFGHDYERFEYASCRWLRANNFHISRTVDNISQSMNFRKDASKNNFFTDGFDALGVEPSVFFALYPDLSVGYTKTGSPFNIIIPGNIDIKAVSCITTTTNLVNFKWHYMHHVLGDKLRHQAIETKGEYKRFEAFNLLDLKGFQISKAFDVIDVVKQQSAVDAKCFPETLERYIIINAPITFSALWRVIKAFLDPQIASKVEIYSSRKEVWQKRLLEFIDPDQLPHEYGGAGKSINDIHREHATDEGVLRQFTHPVTILRSKPVSYNVQLRSNEVLELCVFTKSTKIGSISIRQEGKLMCELNITHNKTGKGTDVDERPTRINVVQKFFKKSVDVQLSCDGNNETYVLVGKIREKSAEILDNGNSLLNGSRYEDSITFHTESDSKFDNGHKEHNLKLDKGHKESNTKFDKGPYREITDKFQVFSMYSRFFVLFSLVLCCLIFCLKNSSSECMVD